MSNTEQDKELKLHFGALANPISKQLKQQGFIFDGKACVHWQKDAEAIMRLRIRGLLPEAQTRKAEMKLFKEISKKVTIK